MKWKNNIVKELLDVANHAHKNGNTQAAEVIMRLIDKVATKAIKEMFKEDEPVNSLDRERVLNNIFYR